MGNVLCGDGRGVENRENRKNRKRFCLLRKNRWCYDETDTTVGFSASNRSIYILKRKANGSWGMCYERVQKLEKLGKSETFLLVEKDSVGLMGPSTCWKLHSNGIWAPPWVENNISEPPWILKIGHVCLWSSTTSGAMVKWRSWLNLACRIGLSTLWKLHSNCIWATSLGGEHYIRTTRNSENQNSLPLWLNKWWCYEETKVTVGFLTSNRSLCPFKRSF